MKFVSVFDCKHQARREISAFKREGWLVPRNFNPECYVILFVFNLLNEFLPSVLFIFFCVCSESLLCSFKIRNRVDEVMYFECVLSVFSIVYVRNSFASSVCFILGLWLHTFIFCWGGSSSGSLIGTARR